MANKGITGDPLRAGGAFDDQDMEDLTSHLASLPVGRGSHDGLDLGDNSELLQGNMDRFRALAGDDSNDELFNSYGGLGLGLGLGISDSTIITTTNYPTYGDLAAAGKPPSYEDSIMYEQAPLGMLAAAAAAGGGGGGTGGDPLSMRDPDDQYRFVGGGGGGGASAAAAGPSAPAGGMGSKLALPMGGEAAAAAAAVAPPPAGSMGTGASQPAAAGSGPVVRHPAAASGPSAAPSLGPLALPGSGNFRLDDLQALSAQLPSPSTAPGSLTSPPPSGKGGGDGRGGGGSSHNAQIITVSEPIKRELGGLFGIKGKSVKEWLGVRRIYVFAGGYVTYLVQAKARPGNGSGPGRSGTTVRRRFREFVALAELLKEKYRGYFVPPRPEKNAMEGQRMTDTFVEERRLALERYLNKLARHPVIGASEELQLFLEVDGELADCAAWLALRPPSMGLGGSVLEGTAKFSKQVLGLDRAVTDPVQAAQPTKKATDFMRAIKETARSMQSPPSTASLPPDELALVRSREEVEALQVGLTTASRAAEKFVSRLDRWSVVNGELGLALLQMRNAEKAEGVALANHTGTLKQSGTLMHDTERVGTALVRSSRIGRKVTGRCAIELGCLHEYLGLMPAALKGLRARDKALLTADTLQSDLEARRKAISELEAAGAKVFGGDAAKAKRVVELSGDVAVLEQSVVAAQARYDRIKEVNQQEVSRLRSELRTDMLAMLQHYAAIMSACSQRHLEIWLQAAGELQATSDQLLAAKSILTGGRGPPAAAAAAAAGGGGGGGGAGPVPSGASAGSQPQKLQSPSERCNHNNHHNHNHQNQQQFVAVPPSYGGCGGGSGSGSSSSSAVAGGIAGSGFSGAVSQQQQAGTKGGLGFGFGSGSVLGEVDLQGGGGAVGGGGGDC
ncbi:hypothetical protein VOLCADRAFT_90391 [Volvox carteri f. nagariensis]|uniref:PX domain-containing protein n=1 Tax=Volvox carteri f. nagariensis TaxID=3068 RepID=D8TU89_VOLCA|nr:uncharacterized protein VOLCADRAFT_90391 [Volvox carteri f. nagariensis]EFJ49103.1 hypothetical protein VOLCADRAFT_90391 [Volvox carteri f. nagariensis]|eukprot:XP_002950000.1 hypothetical protein VOLCADRAFT_90391 [Volvox carteri f. nagariensis]